MTLVMAAEEFRLLAIFPHKEQQMAVGGLHIENGELGLNAWRPHDLEVLPLSVGLNVERDRARSARVTSRTVSNLEPSADASKLQIEKIHVHESQDTISKG